MQAGKLSPCTVILHIGIKYNRLLCSRLQAGADSRKACQLTSGLLQCIALTLSAGCYRVHDVYLSTFINSFDGVT